MRPKRRVAFHFFLYHSQKACYVGRPWEVKLHIPHMAMGLEMLPNPFFSTLTVQHEWIERGRKGGGESEMILISSQFHKTMILQGVQIRLFTASHGS
jgi:hypothetical protein